MTAETQPAIPTPKPLSDAEWETMWCLFKHGPTVDGEVPSKAGRSDLLDRGMVQRADGWNWLTDDGVKIAIEIGMAERKEREDRHAGR